MRSVALLCSPEQGKLQRMKQPSSQRSTTLSTIRTPLPVLPHACAAQSAATTTRPDAPVRRINQSLTAALEGRALEWMAHRSPHWLTSDQLTVLGFAAQIAAGLFYALARYDRAALLLVNLCILLNWFGDSMDGTLARIRQQQRPRYGFYVDHMVDLFGTLALLTGLALSGLVHWPVAIAMLVDFLLLASESYLATHTLRRFELSQGLFGPTELRLLLMLGNFALLRSPHATVFRHKLLLFDLAGTIAAVCMFGLAVYLAARHTAELYRKEPLPQPGN
jgi:phosphatidylglycerophosphate synthase